MSASYDPVEVKAVEDSAQLPHSQLKAQLKRSGQVLLRADSLPSAAPTLDELAGLSAQLSGDGALYWQLWGLNLFFNQNFESQAVKTALWDELWLSLTPEVTSHLLYGLKRDLLPDALAVVQFIEHHACSGHYSQSALSLLIEELFWLYLGNAQKRPLFKALLKLLIALDKGAGHRVQADVVDYALQRFPLERETDNHAIIKLLGASGRYRVLKPLAAFAREYPEYTRSVIRALSQLSFEDVDQYLLNQLKGIEAAPQNQCDPLVLLELVRQVRRRGLRRANVTLMNIFPYRDMDIGHGAGHY